MDQNVWLRSCSSTNQLFTWAVASPSQPYIPDEGLRKAHRDNVQSNRLNSNIQMCGIYSIPTLWLALS